MCPRRVAYEANNLRRPEVTQATADVSFPVARGASKCHPRNVVYSVERAAKECCCEVRLLSCLSSGVDREVLAAGSRC